MKSDIVQLRHARSQKEYPNLALEDNEYVELEIKRSKAGVFLTWVAVIAATVAVVVAIFVLILSPGNSQLNERAQHYLFLLLLLLIVIFMIIGAVLTHVYRQNRMYVTNLRIIRFSSYTPFSHSKNVINLVSVEDVSFRQNSIIQTLFRYGTIRLSTVGDETSYAFPFVDTPHDELDIISHLVHVAKEEDEGAGARA